MREESTHDVDDASELVVGVQDAMLPTSVPVLPSLDLSARFCMPADAEEPVGTWLDVVVVPDGRAALVVGETVGTGMAAAAAMGQVRAIVHASLQTDGDIAAALRLADAYAEHTPDVRGTSVVVAVVDPDGQSMTYGTAGHCGPTLLLDDAPLDEPVQALEGTGNGPLGTGLHTESQPVSVALPVGSVLVLGCSAISETLHGAQRPVDLSAPADVIGHALSGGSAVAMLTARVRPDPHADLDLDLDPHADAVSAARHSLQQWLRGLDAPAMDEMALVHATAELVTNAVEHGATSGSTAPVAVHAELGRDGIVVIEVDDHGQWREPSYDTSRGRGLAMAAGLVDWLSVTSDDGTRARLGHRLSRPVHIDTAAASSVRTLSAPLDIEQRSHGEVALRGDFLDDEADRVAAELRVVSRGGTSDVVVDLSQVTRLSSGAILMLIDMTQPRGTTNAHSARLHLRAAAGSSVSRALDVARIPHDAS